MGGQTELERALRKIKSRLDLLSLWWRSHLVPLFTLREIQGVIIGQHFGPLAGARVTLNGWRSVQTDSTGRFRFRFVLRPISSLTVEWHEVELSDWILVGPHQRVTELKLKWPLLIRGQVVDPQGSPVTQLMVQLNDHLVTKTDAHGTFLFPQTDQDERPSDKLLFTQGDQLFLHHFRSHPQEHLLHRFLLDPQRGLYHLEDYPRGQAVTPSISRFARWVRWSTLGGLMLIALFLVTLSMNSQLAPLEASPDLAYASTQGESSPLLKSAEAKWENVGMLERSPHEAQRAEGQSRPPLWDESSGESLMRGAMSEREGEDDTSDEPREDPLPCQEMEFTYLSYIVPKGMEGILLALVFGEWQSWRGNLSKFNGLDSQHQLQAGQRIKLKLPLKTWSLYRHESAQEWRRLLSVGQCDDTSLRLCRQLLQSWNPHVKISRLRKGDQLLINLDLLQRRPFEGTTLGRVESLRRSSGRRRSRPRIRVSERCALTQLNLQGLANRL